MDTQFPLSASSSLGISSTMRVPLSPVPPFNAIIAPPDFVGFGFETAFINHYANDFTQNLLGSVAKRMSAAPVIRIGGTSGDRLLFDENQEEVKVCIAGDCPIGSSATYLLGPSYFDGFESFQDFRMTFQAPLGPTLNISNSLNYVQQAYERLGDERLVAIAVGNEPNFYSGQYDVYYTHEHHVFDSKIMMHAISAALSFNETFGDKRMFEVLDIATRSTTFDVMTAFENGIDSEDNVKIAAWHWYQLNRACSTLAEQQMYLMNHSAIKTVFSPRISDIAYLKTQNPAVQFVFSETGSGTQSLVEMQAGFGAALWCVDYQLYCMTQGVARVDATHRPAALHSYWVPDDSAGDVNPGPHVRGVWHALPFIADFIGRNPGKVVEVDLGSDVLSAYVMYNAETDAVARVALINLNIWVEGQSTSSRGSVVFSIPFNNSGTRSLSVKRLRSDAGAQAMGFDYGGPLQNITWAGEQWSYSVDLGKGHMPGISAEETVQITNGTVEVEVWDSEAAVVYFEE